MRRRLITRRVGARALDYPSSAVVVETLLDLSLGGTFTRSSVGTYLTGSETMTSAPVDTRRVEDRGDGNGALYLTEGARTNLIIYANAMDSWPNVGSGVTVTADDAVAPDGTTTADRMALVAAPSYSKYTSVNVTSGQPYVASLWIKAYAGADLGKTFRFGGKGGTSVIYKITSTLTGAWARYNDSRNTAASTTSTIPIYDSRIGEPEAGVDGGLAAYTAHVWGHQLENARFPSTTIFTTGTTATRSADILTYATYPDTLRLGTWRIAKLCPRFGNTALVSGNTFVVMSFGGANDVIQFRHNGTNVVLEVKQGGAVKVTSGALTFSAHQALDVTFDSAAGEMEIAGATTGDGTFTGAGWTMSASTLQVGAVQGTNASPYFGRLSNPVTA